MNQQIARGFNALDGTYQSAEFWLTHLRQMVEICSESRSRTGVNTVQDHIQRLLSSFGFRFQRIQATDPIFGDLLICEYGEQKQRFINLVCHADTVFSAGDFTHEMIVKGSKAMGPGVIDNKGGILVAIAGMLRFIQSNDLNLGLRLVCSPNEEVGSPGFHKTFKKLAQTGVITLGFEPAGATGDVIVERKGNLWYDVHFQGQKAHAGRDHHKATNASGELAIKLAKAHALTDYEQNVTVNIGKITGGHKHNIVSDEAFGQLDVRFPCFQSRQKIKTQIEALFNNPTLKTPCGLKQTGISFKVVDDCPPLPKTDKSLALATTYTEIIESIEGEKINKTNVGGAADSNHFCLGDNSIVIDGLGPKGGGMHTNEEFIEIESLSTRAEALEKLLKKINHTGGIH